MAQSKIEWTKETWNPVTGCTKFSAGCANCYALTFARRLKAMGNPRYSNGFNVTIHNDLFLKPYEWKKPKLVFVNSMSDLFHEDVPDEVILKLFDIMNQNTIHTFQILTKRANRLAELSNQINWTSNIWMGVTIENKASLYRCEKLKQTGAHVKFISAEPLLESISEIDLRDIDWLIVGGESGAGYRTLEKEWVIELRDLALKNETAFFFKQWGGFHHNKAGSDLDGKSYKEYPIQYI
jgi:Bacteriophage protein gp37